MNISLASNGARQSILVIFSGDSSFIYLIQRYATRLGVLLKALTSATSAVDICQLAPEAVIFSSIENLEDSQALVVELTNCDIPIIVCTSVIDQTRMRELGADYCLLHPLLFENFDALLGVITAQKSRGGDS